MNELLDERMSSKIRVLDEQTINQIAAGEVIENPASVVKEMVENSIDAGATDICVEIRGGGRQLIRITDNGCGMSSDDAVLCFERHATSKIRSHDDIHSVLSMGFRGEAIPSIGSISKLTLLTCTHGAEEGTLVIVDGGRIVKSSPAARSPGTTIEVKSLFFNVPVRKKFQRSPAYDASEILKVVSIQALAHPEIKFQLINNSKTTLSANISDSKERVSAVLGANFLTESCSVDREHGPYKLTGVLGLPVFTRHNRTGQYLFVNQRAVFSPYLSYAVREGYGTALATNRHPVFVLHLTLPGGLVDVNVHPQKREVRLRQGQSLKEMIIFSVEEALQESGIRSAEEPFAFSEPPSFAFTPPEAPPEVRSYEKTNLPIEKSNDPDREPVPVPSPIKVEFEPLENPETVNVNEPLQEVFPKSLFGGEQNAPAPRVLATLPGYLLLHSDKTVLKLVDQRAAHSRILYEKLSEQKESHAGIQIQQLLIPYTLEVTPLESAEVTENLESLNKLGINIQEFGNHSFIIHAVPQFWANVNLQQLITEIVKDLREDQGGEILRRDKMKRVALAAARAAVSQKVKLTLEEGQSLVNQLMRCKSPYQCPRGKSIIVEMTHGDIAKQFQR